MIQLSPKAMQPIKTALPMVAPATVIKAARAPLRAPVVMTSVTIGPGVRNKRTVMTRKAENSCQFIVLLRLVLAQPLDRHDLFVVGGIEHDHALRRAPGDADAGDRRADQLAGVGDQHDLVALLDREGADDLAGLLGQRHGDDAFAAAAGGPVFIRRRALAVAALRQRQHELLGRRQFDVALRTEFDRPYRLLALRRRSLFLGTGAAPDRAGTLVIAGALLGADFHMSQDRH